MALADLNSIQFYQPLTKASLPHERVLKVLKATAPSVLERGNLLRLWDQVMALCGDNAIEFIDTTDSQLREHSSLFCEPAPALKKTEADIRGRDAIILW